MHRRKVSINRCNLVRRIIRKTTSRFQIRRARKGKGVVQRFEIIISTDYGRAGCSIVRGNGEGTVPGEERNFNFRKLIYFHRRSPRLIASQTPGLLFHSLPL